MSEQKTKYDIIVIGAGPAGYTAGIYSSRARRDTLLISGILPGGLDPLFLHQSQDNFQHL